MYTIHFHIFLLLSVFSSSALYAQISAQGQGGKDVIWVAIGLEQQLAMRWVNKNTIAYSRHSGLYDWNIVRQGGIFTVREELEYRLSKHFKFSQGTFYAERSYYDAEHPAYVNEIRLYPKIYHVFSLEKVNFSQCLRADIRFFSGPGFSDYAKPFEIRNRYLIKTVVPLDVRSSNYMVATTEFFFVMYGKKKGQDGSRHFTDYQFTENRSSLYFRHHIRKPNAFFDIGIMTQTWNDASVGHFRQTYILQMDFILMNPFGPKR